MAESLSIGRDGVFTIQGRHYRIPAEFSTREVFSYRRLLEPIPDTPGGACLTTEQRARQRAYLLRRAAACVIPGLEASVLESLSFHTLQSLHVWIARHRPALTVRCEQLTT
ncbi:MAG: hypothetical protein ACE5JR_08635 [Gemmatimonadota bacterium]